LVDKLTKVYFQAVRGDSAIMSGVSLLPYIVTCCILSAAIGRVVSATGRYKEIIQLGFALMVVGTGLLTIWDVHTPIHTWIPIEIILGLGVGPNFQNMLIAIQATIRHSDMAVATAAFIFICLLGSTLGIAIGGTVFEIEMSKLASDLPQVPGLADITGQNAGSVVQVIQSLPDDVKPVVIQNYAKSMRMIWIVLSAFAGAGFVTTFFIGKHELHRE
jgi:hypothetical protein